MEKLLNHIKTTGENDGVCTRVYINTYNEQGYDCLAVGYCNDEPNRLLTFWQDENDDNFHTKDWCELSPVAATSILSQLKF